MFSEHGVFPEETLARPLHEKIFMMAALEEKYAASGRKKKK